MIMRRRKENRMTIFLMMPPANRHIAWPHIEKFAVLKITFYTAFLTMIDGEQALRYGMAPAGKGFNMRVYIDEIDARIYGIRRQTCRTRIILYFKHNPLFRRFDHPHSIHYYTAPFLE